MVELSRTLSQVVSRLADERGWNRLKSPDDLLGAWSQFVDVCVAGYPMGIDEYENDLSVRSMIDAVLNAEDLPADSSVDAFVHTVHKDDDRFRSLLQPETAIGGSDLAWWRRGVPRYAEAELAEDFATVYGIQIATA